jgi:hypothetical protein
MDCHSSFRIQTQFRQFVGGFCHGDVMVGGCREAPYWELARQRKPLKRIKPLPWVMTDVLIITDAQLVGEFLLRVEFNDGVEKTVDVHPLLEGPIFEPLKDPAFFGKVYMDKRAGTVTWPNGADFAPEALWELPDLAK